MPRPLTVLALSFAVTTGEGISKTTGRVPASPPPAIAPVEIHDAPAMRLPRTTLWSIGDPTDEEQLYLELINRARANPAAEGARLAALTDPDILSAYDYFGVNLTQMQSEMSALTPAPPLAMNAKLLQSSRAHSQDMFTNRFQGHTGSNGSTIQSRFTAAGYSASFLAENVFSSAKSTEHGHAGFEVDWGSGSGGMQTGRGHRAIIHAGFREVGIGIVEGTNGSTGPQAITQDFAVMSGTVTPFVTGVAYYDFNGNNFYDPGEGIGGVTVNVEGAAWHAVTAASGGYAVPVPQRAGTRTVTFSGPGFNSTATATLTGTNNTKVDFKPAYTPPAVAGTTTPVVSAPNSYSLTAVPGASTYSWRAMKKVAAAADNADALTRVNTSISSSYSALSSSIKAEGTNAFRLAQPSNPPRNEAIIYKAAFRGGVNPQVHFQSRLRGAKSGQVALVQVSTNGGSSWSTVYSQNGTGSTGEAAFTLRTVSLSSVAGRDFMLRFNFSVTGSEWFTSTSSSYGWFIDAVAFSDVLDTTGATTASIPSGTSFTFTPPDTGDWLLTGRPTVSGRSLEFGPAKQVVAIPPPSFSTWAASEESTAGLPAGTLSQSPSGDYNRDGVPNLMAYALGLSAVQQQAAALPQATVAGGRLQLDYPRVAGRQDVTVVPQISFDLRRWFAPGEAGAPAGFTDVELPGSGGTVTRRASVPTGSQSYYLRLKATQP